MLQIMRKEKDEKIKRLISRELKPKNDIMVLRPVRKTVKKKDEVVSKLTYEKTNITRKVNETSKLLKNENAVNNLNKIKEIFNA